MDEFEAAKLKAANYQKEFFQKQKERDDALNEAKQKKDQAIKESGEKLLAQQKIINELTIDAGKKTGQERTDALKKVTDATLKLREMRNQGFIDQANSTKEYTETFKKIMENQPIYDYHIQENITLVGSKLAPLQYDVAKLESEIVMKKAQLEKAPYI
jgi:hypothetical protein